MSQEPDTLELLPCESRIVLELYRRLLKEPIRPILDRNFSCLVTSEPGVYVIRNSEGEPVHVGTRPRGELGLRQRLGDHLSGTSSFARKFLNRLKHKLWNGYSFQCLAVADARQRALLEALAIGRLCPLHLGTGEKRTDPFAHLLK
jgi:hypothetical protein